MATIDLNADLAEGGAYDQVLLQVVSSCNIACGAHAGDADSMRRTAAMATAGGVALGAHPGYPDRKGFGRRHAFLAGAKLKKSITDQIDTISAVIRSVGGSLRHVKPHGALYWDAAADESVAALLVAAARQAAPGAAIVGPPRSALQRLAENAGLEFLAEAFVDRAYRPDGTLVPRSEPGAVHANLNTITTQALGLACDGTVTAQNGAVISIAAATLCLHGDTPNAGVAAQAVRDVLEANGVSIRAAH
ncbi:MAG: 5-oxoprolinase subunit PxpA [Gammaproteobacteria bacterium]|nr:5-oxoprolinase subunit PxpA [Gammaproteobacteria bacterium]MDH5304942.1 5-oxoprolinase subunit PxpA [Gammaproteobacteria bacterium]MDH5321722.1 5-oxoprolinase subunit PxpA [Gammaproteobacteria bacterium]